MFYHSTGQSTPTGPDSLFHGLKPRTMHFSLSFNVRMRNDKNEVTGVRNLMNMGSLTLKKQIDEFPDKEKLFLWLLDQLKTSEYDWEANLALYYLTQEDALRMFAYEEYKPESWLKNEKKYSIAYWSSYTYKVSQ